MNVCPRQNAPLPEKRSGANALFILGDLIFVRSCYSVSDDLVNCKAVADSV